MKGGDNGAIAVEYAILLGFIFVVIAGAAVLLFDEVGVVWNHVVSKVLEALSS